MKIWYLICLSFFGYTIVILNKEKHNVGYHIRETGEVFFDFSVCFNLFELYENKKEIKIARIREDFWNFLNRSTANKADSAFKSHNAELQNIISNPKNCFIYKSKFCVILKEQKDMKIKLKTKYLAFNSQVFKFFKLRLYNDGSHQVIVHHLDAKCSFVKNKFNCLNECKKAHRKLSRYYYGSNETGSIYLDEKNEVNSWADEKRCSMKCKNVQDCYLAYFTALRNHTHKTTIFKPYKLIDDVNYFMQLSSLICLFLSISLMPLSSKFLRLIIFKFKIKNAILKYSNAKKLLLFFKLSTLISLLILFLSLYFMMLMDYLEKRDHSEMYTKGVLINNFNLDLSFVFCTAPLSNYFGKTLRELEQMTSKFEDDDSFIKDAYLDFLNKKIKVPIVLKSKVIFVSEYDRFMPAIINFRRCFQIDFHLSPYQSKFQQIFSITKLKLELVPDFYSLYVLSNGENINSHSSKINFVSFSKNEQIKSKLNRRNVCIDYRKAYSNCSNSFNCIDRCVSQKFFERYQNASLYSTIDKDHFTADQWRTAYLNRSKELFDRTKRDCSMIYSNPDCNKIDFEELIEVDSRAHFDALSIDLYYMVKTLKEDEHSVSNLIFGILNVQSILFAFSPKRLLLIGLSLIEVKFKIKWTKFYAFLIYLFCFFGLTYHSYYIYDNLIDSETVNSQYYEVQEKVAIPELVFCFAMQYRKDKQIDLNHKLTYKYLNELTYDLNSSALFVRIEYLNEDGNWQQVTNATNFENEQLKIDTFYFIGEKCFKLYLKIDYLKDQFQFRSDNNVVKIYFNRDFIDQMEMETFYFLSKFNGEMHFSKMIQIWLFEGEKDRARTYFLKQEFIRNDKLLFKNPFALNNDDDDQYLKNLINNFRDDYSYATLNLPLDKTGLEVNDDLFKQYLMHQNSTDHSSSMLSVQNNYATNYLYYSVSIEDPDVPDFNYALTFNRKVIISQNKVNSAKLILNLLNLISLWFDIGILDLHIHLIIIKQIFICQYKILIKLNQSLMKLL